MCVRVGREEMERLFCLKSSLDHQEMVASYAEEYQKLGWGLVALNPQDGTDLKVPFEGSPDTWIEHLWKPGLNGTDINLGVHTGRRSRLLALEVTKGQGESILDWGGAWRAECVAALGDCRERHFYSYDSSLSFDSVSSGAAPDFSWFGEGRVILAPPSFDPETQESWRWLCPPWEKRPQPPSQSLCKLLQQRISRPADAPAAANLSWQEIYCLVSPHDTVIRALFTPSGSMEDYYHDLLEAAGKVGLGAPEVLMALLWHAPLGDARQHPARWDYLQKMVREAQDRPGAVPTMGNDPLGMVLKPAASLTKEDPGGGSEEARHKPGQPGSHRRPLTPMPQPWAARRAPLSCRTRGGSHED
jgi:hypothetical protein